MSTNNKYTQREDEVIFPGKNIKEFLAVVNEHLGKEKTPIVPAYNPTTRLIKQLGTEKGKDEYSK